MRPDQPTARSTSDLLRLALLWLAGASAAGTALELAMLRHWKGLDQLIPWAALAVAGLAIGLVAGRPTGRGSGPRACSRSSSR